MKKIVLYLCILEFSVNVLHAQSADVGKFWENTRNVNKEYLSYRKKEKNRFAAKCYYDLYKKVIIATAYIKPTDAEKALGKNLSTIFFNDSTVIKSVIIINDANSPNAMVLPNGIIRIGAKLLSLLDFDETLAIYAHEIAHFWLKHSEIENYKLAIRERKNNTAIILATSLYAASAATSNVISASHGLRTNNNYINNAYSLASVMSRAAEEDYNNYGVIYSKQQEYEADKIAGEWLDYVGVGKSKMIDALGKLRDYYRSQGVVDYDSDTHPSLHNRIMKLYNP